MEISKDILDELKELSLLLADMVKANVFTVPDGYFHNLDETILAILKEDKIALNNGFSKDILFEVPNGYFENLSNKIIGRIKAEQPDNINEELKTLSPMLYSIHGENVFEVPHGYLNSFGDIVLNKVKSQPAKVVSIQKRTSIFKYAVAAVMTGIMALGVYQFVVKQNHVNPQFAALDPTIQTGIKMNEKQFDTTLNNLSDDEIAGYLEKNASDADIAEITSSIDENNLPSSDDYLLDDKTLDNYLNRNNDSKQKDN
jgi:hypothetical protein